MIAGFGDSHTKINYGQLIDRSKVLPTQVYWFSDGLYILQTTQENSALLGQQIVAINGIPMKTIADSLSTLITADNKAIATIAVPEALPLVQLLEYFGFTKDKIELTVQDLNGNRKTHFIKPEVLNRQNRKTLTPDSVALCYKDTRFFFTDYYIAPRKTYYLQYNKCWSKELELQNGNAKSAETLPSFIEFEERVFQTLEKESIEKLIVDLRFNEGGSSRQGTEFIKKLSVYLKKNSRINLYVIVGRNTFSSAILNAMDFKRFTKAVFVGEETAGKPNHFGEVKNFRLPSSGITVNYSTKYFKQTNENTNTFAPAIKIETSYSDFKKGLDPAYEWIMKH